MQRGTLELLLYKERELEEMEGEEVKQEIDRVREEIKKLKPLYEDVVEQWNRDKGEVKQEEQVQEEEKKEEEPVEDA